MIARLALVALVLFSSQGCVYVNTLPEAKTKLPVLRDRFERFAERSKPADDVGRDEWETARRAYIAELRTFQHDLDPGYEIEEAGYTNPIR
jgi:hypothetical protein